MGRRVKHVCNGTIHDNIIIRNLYISREGNKLLAALSTDTSLSGQQESSIWPGPTYRRDCPIKPRPVCTQLGENDCLYSTIYDSFTKGLTRVLFFKMEIFREKMKNREEKSVNEDRLLLVAPTLSEQSWKPVARQQINRSYIMEIMVLQRDSSTLMPDAEFCSSIICKFPH